MRNSHSFRSYVTARAIVAYSIFELAIGKSVMAAALCSNLNYYVMSCIMLVLHACRHVFSFIFMNGQMMRISAKW